MRKLFHAVFALSLALLVAGLAGCVSNAQNAQARRVVCKKEKVVGSHVPRMVCRDVETAELEGERDRRDLQRTQQNNTHVRPEQMAP